MKIYTIFIFFILLTACNSGKKNEQPEINVTVRDVSSELPKVQDLITGAQIEEALNLHAGAMYDIRPSQNERSNSAFFKLDDDKPNGAILIQVSKNPMPEEILDWDISFIEGIRENGEGIISETNEALKYESLDLGLEGVGNREIGKYLWRDEHKHVYMLAFNVTKTPDEIHEAALKIAKIIDDNY